MREASPVQTRFETRASRDKPVIARRARRRPATGPARSGRRALGLRFVAAVALTAVGAVEAAASAPYANVTYGGPLEPRDTPRGMMQWAFLDMARAWADCDRSLLASLVTEDVRFSFPTTSLETRAALLRNLDTYCGAEATAPPAEVSFYLPDDAFYIDLETGRAAVEIQFRELRRGRQQVTNDVWIATFRDGKFAVMKEYLDGRVRDLQAQGVLSYDWNAPFLTPWPPRTEAWEACFPIVRAAPTNSCPPN